MKMDERGEKNGDTSIRKRTKANQKEDENLERAEERGRG